MYQNTSTNIAFIAQAAAMKLKILAQAFASD